MNAAPSAIAFTMYPVSDMSRAVAFYRDKLGFRQSGIASDAWTEFELGSGTFGVGTFAQVGSAGTAQSLAIEVPDMNAYRAALTERGVESTEPHETPVCFISVVRDPDGNQIWLHSAKAK